MQGLIIEYKESYFLVLLYYYALIDIKFIKHVNMRVFKNRRASLTHRKQASKSKFSQLEKFLSNDSPFKDE